MSARSLTWLTLALAACATVAHAQPSSEVGAMELEEPATFGGTARAEPERAFTLEFGRAPAAYDRRVRSLRFAGWILFSAGISWYPALLSGFSTSNSSDDGDDGRFIAWVAGSAVAPATLLLVGGACLIRARVMVGRKRRFLRRHAQSDGLEVSLAPLGVGLQLGLRW